MRYEINVVAVVLAAGTSSRMEKPKQLLNFRGRYLLEHVIRRILPLDFSEIIAVIGHRAKQIQKLVHIEDNRFRWIVNLDYLFGQSSSLREAVKSIVGRYMCMMVFLGDQPLISEKTTRLIYQQGVGHFRTKREPFIVRPIFESQPGHPVFFGNFQMDDFTGLKGDQGAKKIISNLRYRHLIQVEDPGVIFDIDTREDYEQIKTFNIYHNQLL